MSSATMSDRTFKPGQKVRCTRSRYVWTVRFTLDGVVSCERKDGRRIEYMDCYPSELSPRRKEPREPT